MATFEYDDANWLTALRETDEMDKDRVYVDDPAKVPEGYDAEQGPQGGTFYRPDGQDSETVTSGSYDRPMAIEEVTVSEVEDFEDVTLRFYDDGEPTADLDVMAVHDDPTTLMGPNAGYLVLEDGTIANLSGDRYEDSIPEDVDMRALTDANALVETEQYAAPVGSPDPNEWDIRWQGVTREGVTPEDTERQADRDLLRLAPDEKDQFMNEWKAAAPDEGVENVEDGLRGIKGATTTTGGMFLDKVMQVAWGIDGEPRHPDDMEDRDFEIAEDPTEVDVEAAKVFTAASRKFMAENFGKEFTLHRGLGRHVVDELYPELIARFRNENPDDPLVMRDNPVATWTADEKMANSYNKGIIARKQFALDDVLSTPEALLDFDGYEYITDWNEGEVNVPGWDMETDPSDLYVGKTETTFADLIADPVQAELTDDSYKSPIESFVNHCRSQNNVRGIEVMIGRIKESPEYEQNPDQLEDALEAANTAWDRVMGVKAAPAATERDVVDIREPGNWLVEARQARQATEKSRVYVDSPDDAPEGVQVQEGDRGGIYYDTTDRYGESEGEAPPGKVTPREFNTGQRYAFVADGQVFYGAARRTDSDSVTIAGEHLAHGEVFEGEWTFTTDYLSQMDSILWFGREEPSAPEADLDVNLGRVTNVGGNVALKRDEKMALRDSLREKFGETQADYMLDITQSWKVDSYSDDAATRERTFVEALDGFDGKVRNSELDAATPTPELKEMARTLTELSREFVKKQYGETHTAYRGIGYRAFTELTTDIIRTWESESPPEEVELTMNPMTNYSHTREVASRWGRNTAIIHDEFSPDDVVCATDAFLTTMSRLKDEFEVSYKGGTQQLPAEKVELFGHLPVDRFMEDPDPHDVADVVKTVLRGVDIDEADDELIAGLRAVYRDAKAWEDDAEYSSWPRIIQQNLEEAFAESSVVLQRNPDRGEELQDVAEAVAGKSETGFESNVIELDLTEDPQSVNWVAASRPENDDE